MGAPVASGTLAGSTSGSWASIHKEAAGSDCSRLRRHPRVVGLAHLCRPSRSRTSSPGTTPQPSEKQQSEIGVAGGARFVRRGGAAPRAGGRLSAAAGCGEHTVRWSPAVTASGGRRDYRNRGKGIAGREQPREPKQSWRAQAAERFDVGDCNSAPSLPGSRLPASTMTSCVGMTLSTVAATSINELPLGQAQRSSHPCRHARCSVSSGADT